MFIFDYTEKNGGCQEEKRTASIFSSRPAAPFSLRAGRTAGRFQKQKCTGGHCLKLLLRYASSKHGSVAAERIFIFRLFFVVVGKTDCILSLPPADKARDCLFNSRTDGKQRAVFHPLQEGSIR